jgi:Asp-tRNA(Asn)/Glu-tRNA(Gln) amidotransferase A subunit family amidase
MTRIQPCELSAVAARAAIAEGSLTAEALARSCLERIDARETEIRAWAAFDPKLWLAAARAADAAGCPGPLGGLPLGVKDLAASRDWPTACGSPIYAGVRLPFDAAVLSLTRRAGGVIAGKTATTEFAGFQPGPTRNPRSADRSPGGSSSGSAAAVAAGMVPLALGTQTAGSIVRPAAYCGVVGYKPSFGLIDATGIKPYAPSLDTVGVLARCVADVRLWAAAVSGADLAPRGGAAARIGWCRSPAWAAATPAMRRAFETDLPRRLAAAGLTPVEIDLPPLFAEAMAAQRTIMAFEAARSLAFEAGVHWDRLSEGLRAQIAEGYATPWADVAAAGRLRDAAVAEFPAILETHGVAALVAPSAAGVAPRFAEGTGSPDFNRLWTLLRAPCVQVPGLICSETGLPLGVQVVAPQGGDAIALALAERLETALAG